MLAKLKKRIKKEGIIKVTSDLGYRSINTVNLWFKNNKIPSTAQEKVKVYLSK